MRPNDTQYPGPAWNAYPTNVYFDGLHGASHTLEAGDSPDGQLNLGQQTGYAPQQQPGYAPQQHLTRQPAQAPNFDVRGLLHALLTHQERGDQRFASPGGVASGPGPQFNPGAGFPGGFTGARQMPWDMHHAQVSAAGNLAQFLAQQHTGGLRRFQYNGRH